MSLRVSVARLGIKVSERYAQYAGDFRWVLSPGERSCVSDVMNVVKSFVSDSVEGGQA